MIISARSTAWLLPSAFFLCLPTGPIFAQPCLMWWDTGIGVPGLEGRPDYPGRALCVFNPGAGDVLYAGGLFETAGGIEVDGIAKWDGHSWSPVGGGMADYPHVYALTVFDDGTGPALYAGGSFTVAGDVPANRVAKWDGTSWSAVGGGVSHGLRRTIVYALAVYDDGYGAALYAAGRFMKAESQTVNNIAKWDGNSWSAVGGGMNGMSSGDRVNALAVFDDGNGEALYVGGMFTGAGSVQSVGIAKWDGTSWSDVDGGVGGAYPYVRGLGVFDDGNGPALYAGGQFTEAGGVPALSVAKWDGQTWSALGEGLGGSNRWVASFIEFDDGNGPALYAGGKFTESGGMPVKRIARWTGSMWLPLRGGLNDNVYGLGVFDEGHGGALYAIGRFTAADGRMAMRIAKWGCRLLFPSSWHSKRDGEPSEGTGEIAPP